MDGRPTPANWHRGFAPHLALSIYVACGMLLAGWVQFALHRGPTANIILLIAIAVSSSTFCVELVGELLKQNLRVDTLAALSIATAIGLQQYWVAAIGILRLSGG